MALRGFTNDDERFPGRSRPDEPSATIKKVMSAGGWIRQAVEVDTSDWQGKAGQEIAADLVTQALMIEGLSTERVQYLGHCAEVLGCADPVAYATDRDVPTSPPSVS